MPGAAAVTQPPRSSTSMQRSLPYNSNRFGEGREWRRRRRIGGCLQLRRAKPKALRMERLPVGGEHSGNLAVVTWELSIPG